MDCLFNKGIPESLNNKEIIFKPKNKTFINGISSSYLFIYNDVIGKYMKESQFNFLTNSLNEELSQNWPSNLCLFFGYAFSPCTLGISFICPYTRINQGKLYFLEKLDYYNIQYFNPKNLHLSYHQNCCTSWVKLEIISESTDYTVSTTEQTVRKSKRKEKEFEFNSHSEIMLKSIDSKTRVDIKNN